MIGIRMDVAKVVIVFIQRTTANVMIVNAGKGFLPSFNKSYYE